MSPTDRPKLDKLEAEKALWDAHRQIWRARGVDLDKVSAEWAAGQAQKLASPGAQTDFAELCRHGCAPQVLAATIALFRFSPHVERLWAEMVGRPDKRQKAIRTLEKTAATLDEVLGEFIAAEDDSVRAALAGMGRLPLSRLISELRFYGRFLNLAKGLAADTETRSIKEVTKYLLTGYVKRATGQFRDRNVSALLGELVGPADYDEVAQRMWRARNYRRLEKHFSKLTDLLFAMGVVIARQA
jgi:hypothetical protein